MTIYVTKYALSKGIYTVEISEDDISHEGTMVTKRLESGWTNYYHRNDWHKTEAHAKGRVREMIAAKRRSLAKSLKALDKLEASL